MGIREQLLEHASDRGDGLANALNVAQTWQSALEQLAETGSYEECEHAVALLAVVNSTIEEMLIQERNRPQ